MIPGWGTKILHIAKYSKKKISKHFELGKVLNKMLVTHNNVFLEIKIYNKGR